MNDSVGSEKVGAADSSAGSEAIGTADSAETKEVEMGEGNRATVCSVVPEVVAEA